MVEEVLMRYCLETLRLPDRQARMTTWWPADGARACIEGGV
jgi:hypothetical protein